MVKKERGERASVTVVAIRVRRRNADRNSFLSSKDRT